MVLSDFVTFGYGFGAGCGIGIGNGFFKGTEILGLSAGVGCGIGLGFGWGFGKARARQGIDDNLVIDDSQGIEFENKLTEETDTQKSLESTQKIHSSE